MHWSKQERAFACEAYFSNGHSIIATQRAFRTRFNIHPARPVPGRQSIVSWVNTFRLSGSVAKTGSGGLQTARTPENVEKQKKMAEDNPVEAPKRKRGRPPKPDSEKAAPKRKAETDSGSAPKRGRGRPKGSKNKGSGAAKKPAAKGTGKRGRPPKNPPPKEDASEESAEDAE